MFFINPLFLFAIAGAAVPVIIHLTRDIRAKKIQFSSLMFLRETPKLRVKRRRLTEMLLMALRSALCALLAVLFARPFFPRDTVRLIAGEESQSVVLLLDVSYSMRYGDIFERARNEARRHISRAGAADEFSVVVFNETARQVTALGADKSVHEDALDRLEATCGITDFYAPLQLAEEILSNAQNPVRRIVVLSDFQNNGFSDQFAQWKLNPEIVFDPLKIEQDTYENSYVALFDLKQSRIGSGNATEYKVRLAQENDRRSDVELWVGGRLIERTTIPEGQIKQAFFQQFDLGEGLYQGYVKCGDDELAVDNYYYFSYMVRELPKILNIDGERSGARSTALFLKSAFDLDENSRYTFSAADFNALTVERLSRTDLVLLTDAGSLPGRAIDDLIDFVSGGGGLIISFGENIDVRQMSSFLERLGIGTIENSDILQSPLQNATFGEIEVRHPIFSVFLESGVTDMFRPQFRRYAVLRPDSAAVVIGRFDTGDPFLVSAALGEGKILVFTSSLSTIWTDFPLHEIYVPVLYQMAKFAVSGDRVRSAYLVGEPVLFEGIPGEEWRIKTPTENLNLRIQQDGSARFDATSIPGNYLAEWGRKRYGFSVNVNVRESELQFRSLEEAKAIITKPSEQMRLALATATVENDAVRDEKRQKTWLYLLLMIVALFAIETYVAHKGSTKKELS